MVLDEYKKNTKFHIFPLRIEAEIKEFSYRLLKIEFVSEKKYINKALIIVLLRIVLI